LGGFFPPLVLGAIRQVTGSFTLGFVLLGLFALLCLAVAYKSGSRVGPSGQLVSQGAKA
jgi:NNP family nitrate/nitrite transporter-like MFS transporter